MNRIVLSAFAALVLAGLVGGFIAWRRATEPARAWAEFRELEGVDLRRFPAPERARAAVLFERFAPGSSSVFLENPPWTVLVPGRGTAEEEVLALGIQDVDRGAAGILRVVQVWSSRDARWVGHVWSLRADLTSVRAEPRPEAGRTCLVAQLSDGTRQFHAFRGDRWDLIRVESGEGKIRSREPFCMDGRRDHPRLPVRPAQEWARALNDADPVEVLSALSWLPADVVQADPRELGPLRSEPAVRDAILALRTSPNPWIRDAVELVLRP